MPLTTLDDLTLDPANANAGTVRGTQVLDQSLETYGAGRGVVVDKHGVVIAGNKTVELAVARGLSMRLVPSDGTRLVVVRRTDLDLDTPEARALAYLDNRTAEVGLAWDVAQLASDLASGLTLGTCWTQEELAALTQTVYAPEPVTLTFDTPEDRALWDTHLRTLKDQWPSRKAAARLDTWVQARLSLLDG